MRILNLLIECDVAPVSIYYFRYGDGTYTLLANVGKLVGCKFPFDLLFYFMILCKKIRGVILSSFLLRVY